MDRPNAVWSWLTGERVQPPTPSKHYGTSPDGADVQTFRVRARREDRRRALDEDGARAWLTEYGRLLYGG